MYASGAATMSCSRNSRLATRVCIASEKGDRSGLRPDPIVASAQMMVAEVATASRACRHSTQGLMLHV